MKRTAWMLAGALLASAASDAVAQSAHAMKIAAHYEALAGSPDNALALVEGLHYGVSVKLIASVAASERALPVMTTIDPPTGEMEWSDVERALAMAQGALQRARIARPTAEELEAALLGGDVLNADGESLAFVGILSLHAAGVPWAQVARLSAPRLVVSKIGDGKDH
jgi:hypothetical protein